MPNFGPLAAEIGSRVWGTAENFNGFRVLAALNPNSITLAGSKLVADRFEARSKLVADLQRTEIWHII